jgi:hypothetical protein
MDGKVVKVKRKNSASFSPSGRNSPFGFIENKFWKDHLVNFFAVYPDENCNKNDFGVYNREDLEIVF